MKPGAGEQRTHAYVMTSRESASSTLGSYLFGLLWQGVNFSVGRRLVLFLSLREFKSWFDNVTLEK